jgi:hypothetical protein
VSPTDPIDAILAQSLEPDEALRAVVAALAAQPEIAWAGISFAEDGALTPGPAAGAPDADRRQQVAIVYRDAPVGELAVDGLPEVDLLESVASRIAEYVLLGWDTGGVEWDP